MSAAGHLEFSPDPTTRYAHALHPNATHHNASSSSTSFHRTPPTTVQHVLSVADDLAHWSSSSSSSPDAYFESAPVVLMLIGYFVVVVAGVFGNASLLLTICTQQSARFRNPLLVALCVADLMVTAVSAPLTILIMVMAQQRWSVASLGCKAIYFMQVSARQRQMRNIPITGGQCLARVSQAFMYSINIGASVYLRSSRHINIVPSKLIKSLRVT